MECFQANGALNDSQRLRLERKGIAASISPVQAVCLAGWLCGSLLKMQMTGEICSFACWASSSKPVGKLNVLCFSQAFSQEDDFSFWWPSPWPCILIVFQNCVGVQFGIVYAESPIKCIILKFFIIVIHVFLCESKMSLQKNFIHFKKTYLSSRNVCFLSWKSLFLHIQ